MNIIFVEKLNANSDDMAKISVVVSKITRAMMRDMPDDQRNLPPHRFITYSPGLEAITLKDGLFVSLGGDGTMMYSMKLAAKHGGSVIGMNLGHLGFLADYVYETELNKFANDVQEIASGLCGSVVEHEKRELLVTKNHVNNQQELAANEMLMTSKLTGRLLEFEITVNGQVVGKQKGDGVLISTPTGSTAYNLSAGGSIMSPDVSAMQINIISPHTMTSRPLVIPMNSKVRVSVLVNEWEGDWHDVHLMADGRIVDAWSPIHSNGMDVHDTKRIDVDIKRYAKKVNLWHKKGWNYYDTLSQKMLWWRSGK